MEVESDTKVNNDSTTTSSPLRKLIAVASIAAGIQFGWALQLSLLTPYVQLLGVPHTWAAFIWLCGPISGMVVQPLVGYFSDRSTSRFGRRRPFILSGAILVAVAVFLIGFAADIGHLSGDSLGPHIPKPRATAMFVVGFWILDVANNMLQGPCRAFLADLSAGDSGKVRTGNAFFSFFMAVGNVLGYSAGSYSKIYKLLPFTTTVACDVYCANLKTCFFISITLLLFLTAVALLIVSEPPMLPPTASSSLSTPFFGQLKQAAKGLKKPMWILYAVTALNWIAWFPFLLYDTDWMGKEVYGGDVASTDPAKVALYDKGVHAGALGLMVNSIVLGVMSLAVEPLSRVLGGAKRLWGVVNFVLAFGLVMTVVVTKMAEARRSPMSPPPNSVKAGALGVFAVLGIPLAITFSIPFALASILSNTTGAGQGLSLGVLNLAIVIPQMIVSVSSGPLDARFGGSNLPAFVAGAIAAAVSGVLAMTWLPSPSPENKNARISITMASH